MAIFSPVNRRLRPFWLCTRAAAVVLAPACAPFALDAVEPAVVAPGGSVTLRGAGFVDGLAAELALADGSGDLHVSLQNVQVVSPTEAAAAVPLAAPEALYDVTIGADGRTASLPGALRVSQAQTRVVFIDVGQGDGTLVVAPSGEVLLIDGGPRLAAQAVRDAIALYGAGRLDAVVLSHTDADHLGGIVALLSGADGVAGTADDVLPVQTLAGIDDQGCDSQLCGEYRRLRAYPFSVPAVGDRIALGDAAVVEAEVVAVDGDVGGGVIVGADTENEKSVVIRVTAAGKSVLITGDLTGGGLGDADVETPLAQRTGPVDVLRVGHHGSATSSSASALALFQPRALVLSVGTDNVYCHPAAPVVERLADIGVPIFATGDGVTAPSENCPQPTAWPPEARHGLSTFALAIGADGTLTLAGEAL